MEDDEVPDLVQGGQAEWIAAEAAGVGVTSDRDERWGSHVMARDADMVVQRVPLTIITGFLGSGKTTLLNHLLEQEPSQRVAVILNEFGDSTDLEPRPITLRDGRQVGQDWLELKNGCLCCSVKDVGVKAIEDLMSRRGRFDSILLETTGLADPGPIAELFWLDDGLGSMIKLNGIVTVMDAKFGQRLVESGEERELAIRQIALADRLIVNKIDLVPRDGLDDLVRLCTDINSTAPVYPTTWGKVDMDIILQMDSFASVPYLRQANADPHVHIGTADVKTLAIELAVLPNLDRLDLWIRSALWHGEIVHESANAVTILRTKGLVYLQDGTIWSLQGVENLYEFKPVAQDQVRTETGRLVLIGRGLSQHWASTLPAWLLGP